MRGATVQEQKRWPGWLVMLLASVVLLLPVAGLAYAGWSEQPVWVGRLAIAGPRVSEREHINLGMDPAMVDQWGWGPFTLRTFR